nr:excalibur calcium-binding domain-containing protein [Sphingopyxis sp. BSNA05]
MAHQSAWRADRTHAFHIDRQLAVGTHGGGATPRQPARPTGSGDYYPNCAAARAAGPTPIYRSQCAYGRHLDRDGDGIACEQSGATWWHKKPRRFPGRALFISRSLQFRI